MYELRRQPSTSDCLRVATKVRRPGKCTIDRTVRALAARIIRHAGNYDGVFERSLGTGSKLGIPRGLNRLWIDGGHGAWDAENLKARNANEPKRGYHCHRRFSGL